MKLVQFAALSTELVRGLPRISGEVVRSCWSLVADSPEETWELFQSRLDSLTLESLEPRWSKLIEFEEAIDRWKEAGVMPIGFGDANYPLRWMEAFGERAPRFLFAYGNLDLLESPMIGVVGSRDASDEAKEFAAEVAKEAFRLDFGIVSGAARGIDQIAMSTSLRSGGNCVGITPELSKAMRTDADLDRICLISPFSPDAGFSAGNAMSRNKLIYALGSATIVVQSDVGSGGTWGGAVESISKGIGRVFIWSKGGPGCAALLQRGGTPISNKKQLEELLGNSNPKSLFE